MTAECLDKDQLHRALMWLLPRGRAWQTHDETIRKEQSILQQVLYACATVLEDFETATCAAIDEFFCGTAADDLDLWLEEYGLPDDCDPFGSNLCDKVSFNGGVTLAYYAEMAESFGWSVAMRWLNGGDPEFPGVYATLHVVIDAANSPATVDQARLGTWRLPLSHLGLPNVSTLICALDRAIPAHCEITYEVV